MCHCAVTLVVHLLTDADQPLLKVGGWQLSRPVAKLCLIRLRATSLCHIVFGYFWKLMRKAPLSLLPTRGCTTPHQRRQCVAICQPPPVSYHNIEAESLRSVSLVGWGQRRAVASMVLPHGWRMAVSVLVGDAHADPEGPAAIASDMLFDSGCSSLVMVLRSGANHSVLSGGAAACAIPP